MTAITTPAGMHANRSHTPAHVGMSQIESTSRFREVGWAILGATLICTPMLGIGAWAIRSDYRANETARLAELERWMSHDRLVAAPPMDLLSVDRAAHGRDLFVASCAACHKADGSGLEGLGKNLTLSWFVASLDDETLALFIARGRDTSDRLNSTRVPMPPKGGHNELTDADLSNIVYYMRGLQDPRRMPELPALADAPIAPPTDEEKAKALAAAGGDAELAGYIANGTKLFARTCAACHGPDAKGLKNLGKDLTTSDFVLKSDEDTLLEFIKKGRNPGDPGNTTGVAMPPKGGNPALSDDDLLDVISYLSTYKPRANPTDAAK